MNTAKGQSRFLWRYFFLGLLALAAITPVESMAATAYPQSLSTSSGRASTQPISVLSKQELTGTTDNWNAYVEFYTPSVNYSGVFGFTLASYRGQLSSLVVKANFKGPTKAAQTWAFQLREVATGQWVTVGDNAAAASWRWTVLSFNVSSPARFVAADGKVKLRYRSLSAADDSDLDYLAIDYVLGSSTTPSPTPVPTPVPTATPMPAPTPPPPTNGVVKLTPGMSWYWQLQGTLNTSRSVNVYDIDLFDTSASTIASLKASGKIVVCYFSAGSYEEWRPDAGQFPASALGNNLDGWPGERWLDVRNATVRSIMSARLDLAKSKGCQAVEPDNVDGYSNNNGVGLTKQDQINYLSYLADQAHAKGLAIALKNSTDLVTSLVSKFDFAVVEECFRYDECSAYSPFISQNKAVLNAEYRSYSSAICSTASQLKFSTVFYNLDLDGRVYTPCP